MRPRIIQGNFGSIPSVIPKVASGRSLWRDVSDAIASYALDGIAEGALASGAQRGPEARPPRAVGGGAQGRPHSGSYQRLKLLTA